jgi:hypothetical protein
VLGIFVTVFWTICPGWFQNTISWSLPLREVGLQLWATNWVFFNMKLFSSFWGGTYKAFCMCLSHWSVPYVLYERRLWVYLAQLHCILPEDTMSSVFCTVVAPMLHPCSYSLGNIDIQRTQGWSMAEFLTLGLHHPFRM